MKKVIEELYIIAKSHGCLSGDCPHDYQHECDADVKFHFRKTVEKLLQKFIEKGYELQDKYLANDIAIQELIVAMEKEIPE